MPLPRVPEPPDSFVMDVFIAALAVWGLSGLIVAALLARHGHNFWLYAILGLGYGPFLVAIWVSATRERPAKATIVASGGPAHEAGWIDVLVGLDGTEEAVQSTAQVLVTLGPAIRTVRFASALDHEVIDAMNKFDLDDHRRDHLRQAAVELGFPDAELALISGQADKALVAHALDNDVNLLVVAHRRHPNIGAMRGSTVARLARNAEVPVLIGPPV